MFQVSVPFSFPRRLRTGDPITPRIDQAESGAGILPAVGSWQDARATMGLFPAVLDEMVVACQSPRELLHQIVFGKELAIRSGGADFPLLVAESVEMEGCAPAVDEALL